MNKELSSLNHNEPVFIYRRGGEGEGGVQRGKGRGGGSRGLKGKQRGNQSSLTEFKGGLWKIDFQWRGGGQGKGKGDHWNTPQPHGRDSVNFTLSFYHFKVL